MKRRLGLSLRSHGFRHPVTLLGRRSPSRLGVRQTVLLALTLGALLSVTVVALSSAQVQTIDFIVPAGTSIATGAGGDVITFDGEPTGTSGVGSCGVAGAFPVQNIMLVRQGAPTTVTVILTSTFTGVTPGTQLGNLSFLGSCAIGSVVYNQYWGTFQ